MGERCGDRDVVAREYAALCYCMITTTTSGALGLGLDPVIPKSHYSNLGSRSRLINTLCQAHTGQPDLSTTSTSRPY
jgi:hypothetical protein